MVELFGERTIFKVWKIEGREWEEFVERLTDVFRFCMCLTFHLHERGCL